MSTVKPGDPVRVFDINGSRMGQPNGGWHGKVTKVGRKLVTIEYGGRTGTFRIDDRKANDRYGHRWFMTPEQAALNERKSLALEVLRQRGIRLDIGRQFTVEQIEQLADVARTWK